MDNNSDNAAPSEAPANDPPHEEKITARAYAARAELPAWRLAQICAVTKFGPDDELAPATLASAVAFLDSMTLGG